MKEMFKKNWPIIISITILVLWFTFNLVHFLQNYYKEKELTNNLYEECVKTNFEREICSDIEEYKESFNIPPAPLLYVYIISGTITETGSMYYLPVIAILFVIIPAMKDFYLDIKSGNYKNKLLREKYTTFLKKHYLKSMKSSLILPIFLIITFFITCIVSGFKFRYLPGEIELYDEFYTTKSYARELWIPYFLTFGFCLLAHSIYYINLAYSVFIKTKNYILSIVLTFIIYLLTQLVIVSLISRVVGKYLKLSELSIALSDTEIWCFGSEINNFGYMIITSIIYIIISYIIYRILFNKKERFVILNES